jgi:hypothetical protein
VAEVIAELPERKRGRPSKYPWPLWLDGRPRRLVKQRDFPSVRDAHAFRMMAYNAGKRMDPPVKVRTHPVDADTLELQAWSDGV